MTKRLFSEFNSVSSKQWKQKIQFDLKGLDYNDTLVWKTNDNISVKPFYHADDFDKLPEISKTRATQWKICQSIFVANTEKSNLKALDALKSGAESIKFIIPSKNISIPDLLKSIDLNTTQVHFELQFLPTEFLSQFSNIKKMNTVFFNIDIINNLAKSGNFFESFKTDFNTLESVVQHTETLSIDTSLYENAGANTVQQLAYALAQISEYLNCFKNLPLGKLKVVFNVSISTNYFFEIAKLRALRLLWETLANAHGANTDCHLVSVPSKRNKTLYDYTTNILRTTTECMSALLGGTNTICILPFDFFYKKDNEFSERIARNQLLILKHESYFNKIDNPADGSYYIETITQQLAEKALELFKEIEKNGGFLKQLKEGVIQRKIKENCKNQETQFNTNEKVLLGTNKYINLNEKIKNEIEIYPFMKTNKRKTLVEPIIEKRLSENLEQKRLKNEK